MCESHIGPAAAHTSWRRTEGPLKPSPVAIFAHFLFFNWLTLVEKARARNETLNVVNQRRVRLLPVKPELNKLLFSISSRPRACGCQPGPAAWK